MAEAYLTELPKYGGAGGSLQAARYYAGQKFFQMFGRNPTESELTMLASAYMSGDPNIANTAGGDSVVAQYFQSKQNTPETQEAERQAELKKKAPEHYGTIDQLYQSQLGRNATDAEKEHFGSLLATGTTDAYTISQFLAALPENVKKQDEEFRKGLSDTLQKQDAQYYQEQIMPKIATDYAQRGIGFDSSAYQNALALAAQQQNRDREGFLSNLTADQYRGSQGLAQDAYKNAYQRYYGLQDYSRQRGDSLQDAAWGRANELQNFAIQRQAYNDYLRRYGKRNSWVDSLATGLNMANSAANIFKGWGMGGSESPTNNSQNNNG